MNNDNELYSLKIIIFFIDMKKTIKKLKNCHRQFLLDNDFNSRLFVIILYSDIIKIFYIIYIIL